MLLSLWMTGSLVKGCRVPHGWGLEEALEKYLFGPLGLAGKTNSVSALGEPHGVKRSIQSIPPPLFHPQ